MTGATMKSIRNSKAFQNQQDQLSFARLLGYKRAETISEWENGRRPIPKRVEQWLKTVVQMRRNKQKS